MYRDEDYEAECNFLEEILRRYRGGAVQHVLDTQPVLDKAGSMMRVRFRIMRLCGKEVIEEADEEHRLRYLFGPELGFYLAQAGFPVEHFCPFRQLDGRTSERTWNVTFVARAR